MDRFNLEADFSPSGDQLPAIEALTSGLEEGRSDQTLLGVTGSGKTFTVANAIARVNRPTLVLSPNKTLAAQLYGEFRAFFPNNAVEYFISYYDYYQPEAYLPTTDTYIAKDASINEQIDRLRLRATASLLTRRDVIVVASVSCIYGIGDPSMYKELLLLLSIGEGIDRDEILRKLIEIQYERNDVELCPGRFRVRGDVIEVVPSYDEVGVRIEVFGDEIERISRFEPLTGKVLQKIDKVAIYPAKHFVTSHRRLEAATAAIEEELAERLEELESGGKLLEAQRLRTRTRYDLEMLRELGYCSGIENYSRHLSGRAAGERPACLLDFFPDDFLMVIDESHVSIPQVGGMFKGDRSRKETLVEHGFRLPSALDNRPLNFEEFEVQRGQAIYISATPADYELGRCGGRIVEQIIRPTGLIDPDVSVRPTKGQIDDLLREIGVRTERKERVLVTTLTKRMAEDLTDYLNDHGAKARYLHSEIDALDRIELIRDLRLGLFDVLVGINLLREGLDLPEVSLVAILDADKEGYLRSTRSLIQTSGRAARNVDGSVVMYADSVTGSMQAALNEMERRRAKQLEHNLTHDIEPRSIVRSVEDLLKTGALGGEKQVRKGAPKRAERRPGQTDAQLIVRLDAEMRRAAEALEFERAAILRDQLAALRASISR
ncbi:MAG: excinuclease ABC subunit B [Gemmatimonadetes bacterium]|nr:excinuclease ABC subunit B [Gemmatimonadota bacterium]